MNWKLIFSLSLFGTLMGGASVLGLTRGIEWLLWFIIALICAFLLLRSLHARHFRSALLIGLFASTLNGLFQSILLNTYLSNNPQVAGGFEQLPGALNARVFVLISSVVIGAIYGAIIGLFTVLGKKFIIPSATREPPHS